MIALVWDVDTVLAHLTHRVDTLEKAMLVGFKSSQEAIAKAEAATDRRLAGMNEFRAALTDLSATFVPRSELDQRFAAIEKSINQLEATIVASGGRSLGLSAAWGYLVGAIGLVLAVVSVAMTAWTMWRR